MAALEARIVQYLLDTNICILLFGNDYPALHARVRQQSPEDLGISAITFAELAWGSWNGKEPSLHRLDAFVREVKVLPFDDLAAKHYADLPFKRGSFDRLIAAHALALGLVLVTNNEADFAPIENLKVENWTL